MRRWAHESRYARHGSQRTDADHVHTWGITSVLVTRSNVRAIGQPVVGCTLYRFLADQGTTSECSGACATNWPPLEASGKPTAGKGADPSMIGTTARSDGGTQVTYNGHPVYTFMGDKKPGDTNGEGLVAFGAGWFALSPAGVQISSPATTMPPPPPPTTTPPPPPTTPDDDAAPAPDNDAAPAPAQGCGPGGPRVPQNGGGDGDADNNGGPDDGDGGV
jgi:predicted lipoprotein with Yx(FWY)xxD motif